MTIERERPVAVYTRQPHDRAPLAGDVAGDPPVELLAHPRDLEGQRVRGRVFGIDGRATRVGLRRGVYHMDL